jgi:hypothetical protein
MTENIRHAVGDSHGVGTSAQHPTLLSLLDAHRAKAEACDPTHPDFRWYDEADLRHALVDYGSYRDDAAHIAANDPATIKAFCDVARAAERLSDLIGIPSELCDGDCQGCPRPEVCAEAKSIYAALDRLREVLR